MRGEKVEEKVRELIFSTAGQGFLYKAFDLGALGLGKQGTKEQVMSLKNEIGNHVRKTIYPMLNDMSRMESVDRNEIANLMSAARQLLMEAFKGLASFAQIGDADYFTKRISELWADLVETRLENWLDGGAKDSE